MKHTTQQIFGDPMPVYGGFQTALAALRGHRYAEGEGGAAPTSAEGAPTAVGTPEGGGSPTPTPAPTPATIATQRQSQQETFSRDYVHELREEAKANRLTAQQQQQARETAEQQLAEANKQLAEAQAQLTSYQRETAIRTASKDIANADLLLDSSSFQQSLEQVDLADPEAVKAAITGFVEKNSAYGPTPTLPGSSGGTPTGGTTQTPTTLEGAIAKRLQG